MPRQTRAPHPRVRLVVELATALAGLAVLTWAWRADRQWFEVHTMWFRCAQEPRQLAAARAGRVLGAALGVALVVVLRPVLGRWAERRTAGTVAAATARITLAAVLALATSEIWLRIWPRPVPEILHYEPAPEPDPRLGWRPIPSRVTELPVGNRTVQFVIDENDHRVPLPGYVIDPSRPTILSTGESVSSGFGLGYDETYASMIAERSGIQVVNVAVEGYGNDAAYMRLADALPQFPQLLATVTMEMPAMLERNVARNRPHLVPNDEGTEFFAEPRSDRTWLGKSKLVYLLEHDAGFYSYEAVRRARALMKATIRISKERGAFPLFVLLTWPGCLPDESGAPSIERTLFDGLELAYVRVVLPPDASDPVTFHPGVAAHRQMADAILKALAEHGIVSSSPGR